jgi:hypothetical protein
LHDKLVYSPIEMIHRGFWLEFFGARGSGLSFHELIGLNAAFKLQCVE